MTSKPTIANITAIIDKLEEAGYDPLPYSGRHMHGAECVSVAVDTRDSGTLRDIVGSVPTHDTLGRHFVAYWPRLSWPRGLPPAG